MVYSNSTRAASDIQANKQPHLMWGSRFCLDLCIGGQSGLSVGKEAGVDGTALCELPTPYFVPTEWNAVTSKCKRVDHFNGRPGKM